MDNNDRVKYKKNIITFHRIAHVRLNLIQLRGFSFSFA